MVKLKIHDWPGHNIAVDVELPTIFVSFTTVVRIVPLAFYTIMVTEWLLIPEIR